MTLTTAQQIAKWHREGGVWYIQYRIAGYGKKIFLVAIPGKTSKSLAERYGMYSLSRETGEKMKHITFISMEKKEEE